jgi:hypothetical protein
VIFIVAKNNAFLKTTSDGNTLQLRFIRQYWLFKLSIALVVYNALRTSEEAFRLTQRLELHYTPKHGSWLNVAEIELSAFAIQCLCSSIIADIKDLNR